MQLRRPNISVPQCPRVAALRPYSPFPYSPFTKPKGRKRGKKIQPLFFLLLSFQTRSLPALLVHSFLSPHSYPPPAFTLSSPLAPTPPLPHPPFSRRPILRPFDSVFLNQPLSFHQTQNCQPRVARPGVFDHVLPAHSSIRQNTLPISVSYYLEHHCATTAASKIISQTHLVSLDTIRPLLQPKSSSSSSNERIRSDIQTASAQEDSSVIHIPPSNSFPLENWASFPPRRTLRTKRNTTVNRLPSSASYRPPL
ncbi:hypothetical protein SODALDRAFT_400233 [Sodiomyces alkalinus F11]|uniref:Uncharacterized protein n=1 Tax=Sodiomyces alkalinus (strain CBS 110278 / VKM F-3762 / F11) TaxID=1314773 RepID=A0A3N2PU46_SODAK|nr:hypothetical protein SODALDRAFT_400233 [Sodiomyces alkalinus F11]ROT37984.1 hypothetical protein SODALDRAFT_400233 [Sodiomyces alkalinus F11]